MARRRKRSALVFAADALPSAMRPPKRLPKALAGATCFVYSPGNDAVPVVLPGCPSAAYRESGRAWLRAVIARLPRAVIARLEEGGRIVSASQLTGEVDHRAPATVARHLAALGFETFELEAAAREPRAPGLDALVLEVVGGGGAAGAHHLAWVAGDRRSLCEVAAWLDDASSYTRESLEKVVRYESWTLHVVKAGRVARSIDVVKCLRLDGAPLAAWLEGSAERPRRVAIEWSAMKLPRASARSVRPGQAIEVQGWEALDEDAVVHLRFGANDLERR